MRVRLFAISVGVAVVLAGCGGGGSSEPTEDPAILMPDVVGQNLERALSDITRAGIPDEVEVIGSGMFGIRDKTAWTVCEQLPEAGDEVTVEPRLVVDKECDNLKVDPSAIDLPDVVGMTLDKAIDALKRVGVTDVDYEDVREGKSIWARSNWNVVEQRIDGKTVWLGVESNVISDRADSATEPVVEDEAEAAEDVDVDAAESGDIEAPPDAVDPERRGLEAALRAAFGLGPDDSFASLDFGPDQHLRPWPLYVAEVREEGDLAYIKLQISADDPDRDDIGEKAAQALSTLICESDAKYFSWYIVEDATGTFIAQRQPNPLC